MELDHVFICVDQPDKARNELVQFGLREGLPNEHPGQGTANHRFFFRNAYLELLYATDIHATAKSANEPDPFVRTDYPNR